MWGWATLKHQWVFKPASPLSSIKSAEPIENKARAGWETRATWGRLPNLPALSSLVPLRIPNSALNYTRAAHFRQPPKSDFLSRSGKLETNRCTKRRPAPNTNAAGSDMVRQVLRQALNWALY